MSFNKRHHATQNAHLKSSAVNKSTRNVLILTAALLGISVSLSGCNTTQGFKPTASVIVGAHKSL